MSEHNPYSPPLAVVVDAKPAERLRRPVSVIIAVVLVSIGLAYGLISLPRALHYVQLGELSVIELLWTYARWAAIALVSWQIWRGRNWARVALVVLSLWGFWSLYQPIWDYTHQSEGNRLIVYWPMALFMLLMPLVYLIAAYLVYVPGRAWFRPRVS